MTDELDSIAFRQPNEAIRRVVATDPDSKGGNSAHYHHSPGEDEPDEKHGPPKSGKPERPAGPAADESAERNDAVRLSVAARAILEQKPLAYGVVDGAPAPEERKHIDVFA